MNPDQHYLEAITRFEKLLGKAKAAMAPEFNAMTLSSLSKTGGVSARTVLLKAVDEAGFVFFTNLLSRKGQQLDANPEAALTFFWSQLYCQVLVEGVVSPVSAPEADAYWETRDRTSQLGAWASKQSAKLDERRTLEQRLERVAARFDGIAVPRPDFWSGFCLQPRMIEFWTGRDHRLHDRERYFLDGEKWRCERLYP